MRKVDDTNDNIDANDITRDRFLSGIRLNLNVSKDKTLLNDFQEGRLGWYRSYSLINHKYKHVYTRASHVKQQYMTHYLQLSLAVTLSRPQ